MGNTVDNHLADSIKVIRAYAGFNAGDGDLPPKIRNLGTNEVKYDLINGVPQFRPHHPMTLKTHDDGSHTISINARDSTHLRQLIEHAIVRWNLAEEIAEKLRAEVLACAVIHHKPTPPHDINLPLGDRLSLRSMAKSLLVLLATQIGNEAVLHPSFDGARDFIINDVDTINITINSRRLPSFTRKFGPTPNVIWVGSDGHGALFGYFNLYGVVGWTFKLSSHTPTQVQPAIVINDPVDPTIWTDDREVAEHLTIEWVKASDFDATDLASGAAILRERMNGNERLFSKSLTDELSKTDFSATDHLDPTETRRLIEGLAYRIVMGLFRMPWSEPLGKTDKDFS